MSVSLAGLTRRALLLTLTLVLAAGAFGGCDTLAEEQAPPTHVSLALSREALCTMAYVARNHGMFAANGLDVTFAESSSSQLALQALLDGEVDAALVSDTPIALSALDGRPVRIIATVGADANDIKIVARSDAGIVTPDDVRGKLIGTRQGTSAHFFLHGFLIKYGMSEADVEVHFDTFEKVAVALTEGRLDAAALRQPFISQLEDALGERFVCFEEHGLYEKNMNLCVSMDDPLEPDVQRRILRSLLAAEQYAVARGPVAIRAEVSGELGIEPEDLCDCIVADGVVGLRQSLIMTLEDQARWAVATGVSRNREGFDFLRLLDTRPLDAIAPERVTIIR